MAVSRHCGSPQAAFRIIPRAMGATERGRLVWRNTRQTSLRGYNFPLSFCRLSYAFPLIKPHPAVDARFRASFVHDSCFLDRLKLLNRVDIKNSFSRHVIECKTLHSSVLLPDSLFIARSFSSAQVSSIDDFKEIDLKRNNELEEEDVAVDASSESIADESQSLKELADSKELELRSVRSALRALERDHGMLQERYERACDEVKQLKWDIGTHAVPHSGSSSLPVNGVTVEAKQSGETACSGILVAAEQSLCSKTDEIRSTSSSSLLEIGTNAAPETTSRPPDHMGARFRSEFTGRTISQEKRRVDEAMDLEHPKVSRLIKSSIEEDTSSSVSPLESGESHPWPEWTAFLNHLKKNNYFSSEVVEDSYDADGESGIDGKLKKAAMDFARDRDDIFAAFSKDELKVLASFGCPSSDRKVVNAGKRLRAAFGVSESSVCKHCKIKSTCARAYSEATAGTAATIDVIRLLLVFAFNVGAPIEMKLSLPRPVEDAITSLLVQAVEFSKVPRDPSLPRPDAKEFFSVSTTKKTPPPAEARNVSRVANDQSGMKPGDWTCSECHYVNFSRNRHCRECATSRPPPDLRPGDWECTKCQYVNYAKNKQCRDCNAERPRESLSRGRPCYRKQGSEEPLAFGNRERDDRSDSFRGRRDGRREFFGNRERDDRRDSYGEFSRSAGRARPKHQEWKPDMPKKKSGYDFDDDANHDEESMDMEDADSELDDLELDESDLDEDYDDVDASDEEVDAPKHRKNINARKSNQNKFDNDDFWEDLDEKPKGRGYTRSGSSSDFDNDSSSGRFSSRGRPSRGRGGRGGQGGGRGRSRGRGGGRGR